VRAASPRRKPAVKQQAERALHLDLIAAHGGLRLEGDEARGYQLVSTTGTLVAADFAKGGFGLSLDQIEAVLEGAALKPTGRTSVD
jgi:hypothetical protein